MHFSRNQMEGTFTHRHHWTNRKYGKRTRLQKKRAKLSFKGTLRSITQSRVCEIFYHVGVQMAREEKRDARKRNEPIHFRKGDLLRVVSIDDCEEGLRLGDVCTMEDRSSEYRPFIIVKLRRNGRSKQIEKTRFVLHSRYVHGE
jgi:hypothetical protein